jgi:transposase InsO family protein
MERRGKASTGHPTTKNLSAEEKTLKASENYQLIEQTIRAHQLKGQALNLCQLMSVEVATMHGLKGEEKRQLREKSESISLRCEGWRNQRDFSPLFISTSLEMNIVYQTLIELQEATEHFHPEAILHSNQEFHYTHPLFQDRVKKLNIRQSMSRRGNCSDNAPMESSFSHFKD